MTATMPVQVVMLSDAQLEAEIVRTTGGACCTEPTCKRRIELADYLRRLRCEAQRRQDGAS